MEEKQLWRHIQSQQKYEKKNWQIKKLLNKSASNLSLSPQTQSTTPLATGIIREKSTWFNDRQGLWSRWYIKNCTWDPKNIQWPTNPSTKVQIRYQLGYTKSIYKFLAETGTDCCYETFTRHVLFYIKKASASDWGMCLCMTCLNPELKIQKLVFFKLISSINLETTIGNENVFQDLLDKLRALKCGEKSNVKVNIVEWNKIPKLNAKGKKIIFLS